jgi:peptidoglycan/LPS O-acetylase OafA/YrhL
MTASLSVYLDLVRFAAAVVVVLSHVWPVLAPARPVAWPGHQAVIVFFVLSGCVIAHAADSRERRLADFVLRRIARLWSVALPALLLGGVAALAAGPVQLSPAAPVPSDAADLALRTGLNAVFAGELWWADRPPPVNSPYWSLNYEAWYYALFAAWTWSRGPWRAALPIALAAVAGPRILLLLPAWLAGVAVARCHPALTVRQALLLFAATGMLASVMAGSDLDGRIAEAMASHWPRAMERLFGSHRFVGDTALALVVAIHFAAAARLGPAAACLQAWAPAVRRCAGYTFSAYLYHMPLFVLLWSVSELRPLCLPLLAVGIVVLGRCTEHRGTAVRRWLEAAWRRAGRRKEVPLRLA